LEENRGGHGNLGCAVTPSPLNDRHIQKYISRESPLQLLSAKLTNDQDGFKGMHTISTL
jgi:hypothetical protein